MAFGWLKKTGKVLLNTAPVAAAIAGAAGVPYADRIGAVIQAAAAGGGTGKERMQTAIDIILADAPALFRMLEKQFGRPVTNEASTAYVRAQVQAHYDLLKSMGALPKT